MSKIFKNEEKNKNCLSGWQTVPNVRTYLIFVKINDLDVFELRKIWRGSPEISGALEMILKNHHYSYEVY